MSEAVSGCDGEYEMNAEYVIVGLISLGLLGYLCYALLRPERI